MFRKKSLKGIVAIFLLICFSAVAFPVDLFHQHAEETTVVCKDAKGSCEHKFHLSKTKSFCWLCAFHFDKTFSKAYFNYRKVNIRAIGFICELFIFEIAQDEIITLLRGPPSQ